MSKTKTSPLIETFFLRLKVDGFRERTIRVYEEVLSPFQKFLGDTEVEDAGASEIRAYLFSLRDRGLKPTTISYHFRHLRAFYNYLVREDLLEKSPMEEIRKPKVPFKLPHVLEEHQVQALLRVAKTKKSFEGLRNYTMLLVLLDCGLRLSELINLNIPDINLSNRSILVKEGKGDKQRVVYTGNSLVKAFLKWLTKRGNHPYEARLFVSRAGEPLKRRRIEKITQDLGKEAGIEGVRVSPHTFRHTALTTMLRNGMDIASVQAIAGHSQISTTAIYLHTTNKHLQEMQAKHSPLDSLLER